HSREARRYTWLRFPVQPSTAALLQRRFRDGGLTETDSFFVRKTNLGPGRLRYPWQSGPPRWSAIWPAPALSPARAAGLVRQLLVAGRLRLVERRPAPRWGR